MDESALALQIRREFASATSEEIMFFGVAPQRRLSRLARSIANQDTAKAVSDADSALGEALALLDPSSDRLQLIWNWFVLPWMSKKWKWRRAMRHLRDVSEHLSGVVGILDACDSDVNDLQEELSTYLKVGKEMLRLDELIEVRSQISMRVDDLAKSVAVVELVAVSLNQRQRNFRSLREQINRVLGSGVAARFAMKAAIESGLVSDLENVRATAKSCQTLLDEIPKSEMY